MSDIQLQIEKIKLRNFRNFQNLQDGITFDPKLTVIVAKNGSGKTAILDAIKIAFGSFTKNFPCGFKATIAPKDAHIAPLISNSDLFGGGAEYPVSVEATALFDGIREQWSRERLKARGGKIYSAYDYPEMYGRELYKKVQKKESVVALPIVAFYGTGRLWNEFWWDKKEPISPLAQSRFWGYEDAFSSRTRYIQVREWLASALLMENAEARVKTEEGKVIVSLLHAITGAIETVLGSEGWRRLHYNQFYEDLALINEYTRTDKSLDNNDAKATTLPVSWHSDGVRSVFALVADIAFRCVKLNMHLGKNACKQTQGVVMVDEVDMFLHPAWQQHILLDLQKAFPRIQFIVTTHSPQVISSVPKECVRIIKDNKVTIPDEQTKGVESQNILAEIFGTSPAPQILQEVKDLHEFNALVAQRLDSTPKADALLQKLIAHFGNQYPELQNVINHRDFLKRMGKGDHHAQA